MPFSGRSIVIALEPLRIPKRTRVLHLMPAPTPRFMAFLSCYQYTFSLSSIPHDLPTLSLSSGQSFKRSSSRSNTLQDTPAYRRTSRYPLLLILFLPSPLSSTFKHNIMFRGGNQYLPVCFSICWIFIVAEAYPLFNSLELEFSWSPQDFWDTSLG